MNLCMMKLCQWCMYRTVNVWVLFCAAHLTYVNHEKFTLLKFTNHTVVKLILTYTQPFTCNGGGGYLWTVISAYYITY